MNLAAASDASGSWAPYVGAAAALLAAVFAGVNLLRTERRETLRVIREDKKDRLDWRRSALQGAFVDFLTASYNHKTACERILRLRLAPQAAADTDHRIAEHKRLAEDAHQVMLDCASRLRLLTSDDVAQMALDLWHVTKAWMQMLDLGRYDELRDTATDRERQFLEERDEYIVRAQELLGIDALDR